MRRAFAARNARARRPGLRAEPARRAALATRGPRRSARRSSSTARRRRRTSSRSRARRPSGPHTTHFSVVDAEGNAVAMTTTLNSWFGSGVTVPGLGFVLNDEMDDFATVPGDGEQVRPGAGRAERHRARQADALVDVADHRARREGQRASSSSARAGGSRIITAVFERALERDRLRHGRVRRRARAALPPAGLAGRPLPRAARAPGRRASTPSTRWATRRRRSSTSPTRPAHRPRAGLWHGAAEPRREGSLAAGP